MNHPASKVKSISLYMISQAVTVLLPFLTLPVFTRFIPPADYGVIDLFQIVMIVGLGLGNWGLQTAFERFFFEFENDREKQLNLLSTLLLFSIGCLTIVFIIIFFYKTPLAFFLTHRNGWVTLMLLVVIAGYFEFLNNYFFFYYKNSEEALNFIRFEILRSLLVYGIALFLVVVLKKGILGIALGQASAQALIFLLFLFRFGIRIIKTFDRQMLRESLKFGWPLMSKVFLSVLNVSIDKYMVGAIISLSVLGVYGRGQRISYGVFMIMTVLANVYMPRWNKLIFDPSEKNRKSVSKLFTEYVVISIIPAFALVLFAQEVVSMLFPPAFHDAMPVIAILSVFYSLQSFGKILGNIGTYLKMTKFNAIVILVSYPINIGLNLLLIPRWGMLGSVFSTFIVGAATLVVCYIVFQPRYRINYEQKSLFAMYGLLTISCIISLVGFYSVVNYPISLMLRISMAMAAGILLVNIFGVPRFKLLLLRFRSRFFSI